MPWTIETIRHEWLLDGNVAIAIKPETLVASFNEAEAILGKEWIETVRYARGSLVQGAVPTLRVAVMGLQLAALAKVRGDKDKLISFIRRGDDSAESELNAIHLLSQAGNVEFELYPKVAEREADFRFRLKSDTWTYAEVTKPDISEAQSRFDLVFQSIFSVVGSLKKKFGLEVFLRREPDENELSLIVKQAAALCDRDGRQCEELTNDLGFCFLNHFEPEMFSPMDHGEPNTPRIAIARSIKGPDEPHRTIVVRMAYADSRAEAALGKEAGQLPKDSPGLIMVGMNRVPGGFTVWEPALQRRLQPTLYTRVSGICLFADRIILTSQNEHAFLPETKIIQNRHAKLTLPAWIPEHLRKLGEELHCSFG